MFGQASPRWPASTALVLMVALFGVYLNSDLYLASPVTDHSPDDSNNLAEHAETEHPEHHNSTGSTNEAADCLKIDRKKDVADCAEKAAKEDFAQIKDQHCQVQFALFKCDGLILCQHCNKGDTELVLKLEEHDLDVWVKGQCKEWESMAPKLPSSCSGERSGFFSDNQGLVIGIIVGVVLVVGVIIAVVVYCLMCAGDSKGNSAKPGKSSKGGKSMKAGKSNKSGIKGGKSTKSSKSAKSGKSGKSLKGGKSTKSSKGGKSAKK